MTVRRVRTERAPQPGGAYSQAVAANGFLFTAGMGPHDPDSGLVLGEDIATQTRQVMSNLQVVLAAESLDLNDVVKATVHLEHLDRDFAAFNETYSSFFSNGAPVRTTVGSTLANILVEIDVIAAYTQD
jgi:2-iminobutanoate/2-iminopropanoate deaminase